MEQLLNNLGFVLIVASLASISAVLNIIRTAVAHERKTREAAKKG